MLKVPNDSFFHLELLNSELRLSLTFTKRNPIDRVKEIMEKAAIKFGSIQFDLASKLSKRFKNVHSKNAELIQILIFVIVDLSFFAP